ncbi:hypothetical protein [Schlesneria paludicola]|uniref:hypothetical protein n=1 Tax=Schlesneria paludicola TaxID=360056 RepID=UPI000299D9A9|nr:hypothetical protein [Schlesneria paludicola]
MSGNFSRRTVFALIAVAIILSFAAVEHRWRVMRSERTRRSFRQLSMWLHDIGTPFADIECSDNKTPCISWRGHLVDWVVPKPTHLKRTESWSQPDNLLLGYWGPLTHLSNEAQGAPIVWRVVGEGTAFVARSDREFDSELKQRLRKSVVVFVETEKGDEHWMKPGDLSVEKLIEAQGTPMHNFVGGPSDGIAFHVGFSNGDVVRLRSSMPACEFAKLAQYKTAGVSYHNQIIAPYRCDLVAAELHEFSRLVPN